MKLGALTGGGETATVTGFAIDHRKVAPGTVFGAFQGTRVNGEDFIPAAIAAGAVAVVTRPGVAVQGAWGNIPAYLNELSPPAVRAMFPGLVYQFGNLVASRVSPIQAGMAESHGGDYAYALAVVTAVTAAVLIAVIWFGPEKREELE